eukprot:10614933-Ditylum_brightwellii.AAC.1
METPPASQTYSNFVEETIVCAPLQGVHFEADSDTVYKSLTLLTTRYPSEDRIQGTSFQENTYFSIQCDMTGYASYSKKSTQYK